MIIFVNGKYCDENDKTISPNDRGYLFGDGVYEGCRIYNKKIFKLKEHNERFQRSINELKINYTLDKNEVEDIYQMLLEKNSYENEELFFYIQITRGTAPRAHAFPIDDTPIGIYAFLVPKQIDMNNYINGIKVCTVPDNRWARCDIKCISLVANCMANEEAKSKNCIEGLFVHDGVITEGTLSNVFFVINKVVYTHAKTNRILAGVTRNTIVNLCEGNNIKVEEFPLTLDKLEKIDEAFLTGTTGEVTPIVVINDKKVSTGDVGEITKILQKLYKNEIEKDCFK